MEFVLEDILKIALAIVAGGLIGLEREFRDKAAGFRTLIFICLGAALFAILSSKMAGDKDPTRIAASIVTGVGFLGAGVIMREGGRVTGLTTAATIWMTAAFGMGIGAGDYALVGAALGLAMIVLWLFPFIERRIDNAIEERSYEIICSFSPGKLKELETLFRECGLRVREHRQMKSEGEWVFKWHARGPVAAHQKLADQLVHDEEVRAFNF